MGCTATWERNSWLGIFRQIPKYDSPVLSMNWLMSSCIFSMSAKCLSVLEGIYQVVLLWHIPNPIFFKKIQKLKIREVCKNYLLILWTLNIFFLWHQFVSFVDLRDLKALYSPLPPYTFIFQHQLSCYRCSINIDYLINKKTTLITDLKERSLRMLKARVSSKQACHSLELSWLPWKQNVFLKSIFSLQKSTYSAIWWWWWCSHFLMRSHILNQMICRSG